MSLSFLLLLPALAPAQDLGSSESYVYAPRDQAPVTAPASQRTVIEGEAIRATGRRSLPQALAAAAGPGVWLQETNLGGGSAFVRGLTGNQVLILVDGVRLNDATTRFGPNQILNTIDPAVVERIEVLRGPASVLYGSDAIGGVIHIHTRRQRPVASGEYLGYAVDLNASTATMGGRVTPQVGWATEEDGLLAMGSLYDYDDLSSAGGEVPHTGYGGNAAFLSWVRDLGEDQELSLTTWMHRDEDVPRTDKLIVGFGQTNPSDERHHFTLQDRRALVLGFSDESFDYDFADSFHLRLSAKTYDEERERIAFGASTLRFERDEVESIGLSLEWQKLLGDEHLLTYGLDVDHDEVDSFRRDTDLVTTVGTDKDGQFAPNADYSSLGLFLQDEIFSFEPVDVTAGVRFSAHSFGFDGFGGGPSEDGDFSALTASLQAARDLAPGHRVSATLAQGFRAPNLDDLAKDGDFGGGTELHNSDLDPETSLTAELAYDYTGEGSSLSSAVFVTEIDDVIGRRLQDPGTPATGDEIYLRDNAGELRLIGFEVGGAMVLTDTFELDYGAAVVSGRQHDSTIDVSSGTAPFDGVDWRRVPPLHGSVGLTWTPLDGREGRAGHGHFGPGFEAVRLGLNMADRQDDLHPGDVSDPRIDPNGTPGWARVDIDIWGPLGEGDGSGLGGDSRWFFGVHNLLNADYRMHGSGFDAPGFALSLGIHWTP
ncbi:MAG: TonB-dependent receptor [Planctomycetota bacterium]|nr:TonB-dependent receptor [Planctomycetota bacterium]